MARHTSFTLGDHFNAFVEAQIGTGRYGNASEVVRAGPRLLEERETRIAALREALIEGETSGPATDFDFDAFLSSRHAKPDAAE